jgi:colanic acid biosynthesis protein WcaH
MTDSDVSLGKLRDQIRSRSLVPEQGLPEELFLFVSQVTPLVNVDLLIRDPQRGVLLTWREDEYHGAGWHVPGGIVRYRESFSERIHAVARTELGTDVVYGSEPMAINQIILPDMQARGHFISLLFACRLDGDPRPDLAACKPLKKGAWQWHETCPDNLIPVHEIYRCHF